MPLNKIQAEPAILVDTILDGVALSENLKKDVLVIFTADWCPACKKMKKDIVDDLSMVDDKIICYVNVDQDKDLVKEYKVRSLPDYFILRNNTEMGRMVGYKDRATFIKWLNNVK